MVLVLLLLFSIPIACFASWFAWHAHKAGKKRVAMAMGLVAIFCISAALLAAGWGYLVVSS